MSNQILNKLRSLRTENGLYLASTGEHYQKVWVRDTFYCVLPELTKNPEYYKETYRTLLDYYINIEEKYGKFSWLIKEPHPKSGFRYPHPRMTLDLDEIRQEWGFKQNDCLGEFLYGIYLGQSMGIDIIRDSRDIKIINLIIETLESLEYWNDKDSGIWEEYEEVHASSVGACLAGLTSMRLLGFKVDQALLDKAHETLNDLLPRESVTKEADLALLTLIYPFNIVDMPRAKQILANTEAKLLRERGVIRYKGDVYYNRTKKVGDEAEWSFGLAFLSLAYATAGEFDKARHYLNILNEKCVLEDGKVPELFYARTDEPNDNNPLGWSMAMTLLADEALDNKKHKE